MGLPRVIAAGTHKVSILPRPRACALNHEPRWPALLPYLLTPAPGLHKCWLKEQLGHLVEPDFCSFSSPNCGSRKLGRYGHSCHSEVEYRNSEIKPSFPSKVENGIKNNVSERTRLPSTENIVVLSLSLLIIPFVPATNLFFYVGFVIAERVLYIPSMGFCLLITVGARALYVKVQKRFLKSLIFYATATLIVFYGLKTAIRNGDWQNEEMLYRSGIKVNPAKGNILFYAFAWMVYIFCLFISLLLALKHTVLRKKRFFYSILIIFVLFKQGSSTIILETSSIPYLEQGSVFLCF